jgi:hypothetical protein
LSFVLRLTSPYMTKLRPVPGEMHGETTQMKNLLGPFREEDRDVAIERVRLSLHRGRMSLRGRVV